MIFMDRRKRLLSPHLSGYVRASTDNPTGWRPQYVRLGAAFAPANQAPDWKAAAAARDAACRRQGFVAAAQQRAQMAHATMIDAHARGDRTRVRMAGLGCLGTLDLGTQMVPRAQYIFHFTYGGVLGLRVDPIAMQKALAASTNFAGVSAGIDPSGVHVQFTYNGGGNYSLGSAANEMQAALNVYSVTGIGTNLVFASADGGPATPARSAGALVSQNGTISQYSDGSVYDSSTGLMSDAAGNIISNLGAGSPPPSDSSSSFSWENLLSGAAGGVALTVAAGLGLFLLLRG